LVSLRIVASASETMSEIVGVKILNCGIRAHLVMCRVLCSFVSIAPAGTSRAAESVVEMYPVIDAHGITISRLGGSTWLNSDPFDYCSY
jgi:hypothetical protein